MKAFWSCLILVLVFSVGAQAQILENSFDPNPIAAISTNPALQHSERDLEFALGLSVGAHSNSWNPALITRYGSKDLNEADKDVILKATNGQVFRLTLAGQPYLGVKYGSFGLRASGQIVGNGQIPSEVLRLALKGNELNKEYKFSDANGEAAAYAEAALTFAAPINPLLDDLDLPEIIVSVSGKYLHGFAFGYYKGEATVQSELADGVARVSGEGTGTYAFSLGGSGFAMDFGVSTTLLDDKLKLDASILNLGTITWRNVEQGSASMDISVDLDDLENAAFNYEVGETVAGANIAWKVPRTFRLGAAYKAMDQLTVLADLSLHSSEATGLSSRQVVGLEYRPWDFMPIQTALIKQSKAALRLDLGWGLEFANFEFDISLINALGLLLPRTEGMGLHLHTSIRF